MKRIDWSWQGIEFQIEYQYQRGDSSTGSSPEVLYRKITIIGDCSEEPIKVLWEQLADYKSSVAETVYNLICDKEENDDDVS